MLLSELIGGAPAMGGVDVVRGDPPSVRICDLTEDSRTVMPGSLFVARRGHMADGHAFIADAIGAGAAAVLTDRGASLEGVRAGAAVLVCDDVALATAGLAERFYGVPSRSLLVAAVTGTNGKTTVAHLVHRILNRCGVRCGLIGTVEIDDGAERAVSSVTTPGAIELSRTLSVMVETGCRAAVLEASSHGLDQKRVDGLALDAAVFTNLSGDHLDYHGTMEAYAAAKRRLFELADASLKSAGEGGVSIVNADDPWGRSMAGATAVWCTAGGGPSSTEPNWSVETVSATLDGTRLRVRGPGAVFEATIGLIGAHNAMNALQAAACCDGLLRRSGVVDAGVRAGLLSSAMDGVGPPPGRLEPVHGGGDRVRVLVDYAHTDDALARTLAAVRGLTPSSARVWVVFGAGGERDKSKRPRMGAAACAADRIVVTSDNPRTEAPETIIGEILAGIDDAVRRDGRVSVHADRREAIERAVQDARDGDAIVIAGKGHETEQVLPDGFGGVVSRPFDDRAEARRALGLRRGAGEPPLEGAAAG